MQDRLGSLARVATLDDPKTVVARGALVAPASEVRPVGSPTRRIPVVGTVPDPEPPTRHDDDPGRRPRGLRRLVVPAAAVVTVTSLAVAGWALATRDGRSGDETTPVASTSAQNTTKAEVPEPSSAGDPGPPGAPVVAKAPFDQGIARRLGPRFTEAIDFCVPPARVRMMNSVGVAAQACYLHNEYQKAFAASFFTATTDPVAAAAATKYRDEKRAGSFAVEVARGEDGSSPAVLKLRQDNSVVYSALQIFYPDAGIVVEFYASMNKEMIDGLVEKFGV